MKHDLSTMSRPLDGNADPDVYTKQGGKIPPQKVKRKEESTKNTIWKSFFFLKVYG